MKRIACLVAIVMAAAAPAAAQQAARTPLVRADLSATTGWFNASRSPTGSNEDWFNRSLYAGIEAGWYWTDHLKAQVDFGGHTTAHLYRGEPIFVEGINTYESSRLSLSERKLTVTGQYQFGRNAWFHPHVGAGVDFSWESTSQQIDPVYFYSDPLTRLPRLLREARTVRRDELIVRPCADVGFKAYMTPRAFFRTDLRLRAGTRIDEALLRFGFGVDF